MVIQKSRQIALTYARIAKIEKLAAEQYTSNSQLAKASGLHRNTISKILNKRLQYMDVVTWQALQSALDGL